MAGGDPGTHQGLQRTRRETTTCAKAEPDLLPALERVATEQDLLTLTDLGYENLSPAMRHPVKKPAGRELTGDQRAYNQLIRGVHGVAERANSLLKTTFKALRRVSLDPWRIGAITRAALVLLQLEHGRTACPSLTYGHQSLPRKAHWASSTSRCNPYFNASKRSLHPDIYTYI